MATEKMDFELVLTRLNDLEKLYTGFQKSSKAAKEVTEVTGKMAKQISSAVTQAQKLQQALSSASGGLGVGQLEKVLARGNPITALKTAAQRGELKDFESQFDQMFARINNKFRNLMKETVKGATSANVVGLSSKTQSTPANTLGGVNSQIEAQTYRVAAAEERLRQLRGAAATSYQASLTKEKVALDGLVLKKEQLINEEKKLQVERGRSAKVDSLLGDGGASLFKIQAGLLVNYQLMSQIFSLFQFGTRYVVEYDKALRDVQAVTDTTNIGIQQLSKTFIDLSQQTKFSAVELAQAALTLGQAGLSVKQINESIGAIANLATASGSDLATSVDVVTSALTVFNLNATETAHIADVMTGALNLTKLTMDKLQLGIQYAGNAAAEAGITLEELVSSLGAMSNAGIKSGSTLGTGLTQIIVELQNPTKKLHKELDSVGLKLSDVDVKAKGLTGVLETMRDAGFGSANAFKSMDLRAARAYLALSRNVDSAKNLEVALQLSTAASKASETQMLSLSNSGAKLRNTFGAFILEFGEPFKNALIAVTNLLSNVLGFFNQFPGALNTFGTLILAAFSAKAVSSVALLVSNLGLFRKELLLAVPIIGNVTKLIFGLGTAETVATASTTRLGGAMTLLGATPMGRLASVLGLVVAGFATYTGLTADASDATDKLQASLDAAKGEYESTAQNMEAVDGEISRLINRYDSLSKNSQGLSNEVISMQTKFGNFTDQIKSNTITTVNDLIRVLQNLRGEMAKTATEQLRLMAAAQAGKFMNAAQQTSEDFSRGALGRAYYKGPITQSMDARDSLASLAGGYSSTQIDTLDAGGLSKGRGQFQQAWEKINSDSIRLAKENNDMQSKINAAKKGEIPLAEGEQNMLELRIKANQKQLDLNTTAGAKARELQSQFITQLESRNALIKQEVSQSADIKPLTDAVTKARIGLSEAKASGSEVKVKEAEKALEDTKKKIQSAAGDIAAKTGYSQEDVASVIEDTLVTQVNESLSDAGVAYDNMTQQLGKSQKDYLGKITEKQKMSLEALKREYDLVTAKAQTEISRIDASIGQMTDKDRGGLRGLYSDAEVSMLEDRKKDIQTQSYADQAAKLEELLPKVAELRAQQEAIYIRAQKAADANPKDGSKLQAALETHKDYNAAIDEEIKLKQELEVVQAQRDASMGKETIAHKTLGEQIQYTLNKYRETMFQQDDLGLNIKENLTGALDSARGSFNEFLTSWINGTATAGSAFKAFGYQVLQTLQEMAVKSLTNQIFGQILNFAGSAISGMVGGAGKTIYSAPIGPTISGAPLPSTVLNAGGMVPNKRAAAGMAVNTRDSVPVMVRPGEYILRNSAVDAIGKDNLDMINAYGNRTVERAGAQVNSAGMQYASQQQPRGNPVNVYVVSPEQKPTLTENDVLVTIQKDLAKGGKTAQLIKTVMPR